MQEQLAHALRCWNFVTGALVGLDIRIVEKGLAVLDSGKSIADVGFTGADRLYFASLQFDAGLVALDDVKITESLPIENRLGRHEVPLAQQANACAQLMPSAARLY